MKVAKRSSFCAPKNTKRKKKIRRRVRSIVAYLKSDGYLFAPLFSNFRPLSQQIQMPPPSNSESLKVGDVSVAGFEELGIEKKRRMSEKVNEYLKSDCHMYGPMISSSKRGSSPNGKLEITNLVRKEVSTSTTTTTTREDNNDYRNLRSVIAEQTLHKGRMDSPKQAVVIVE